MSHTPNNIRKYPRLVTKVFPAATANPPSIIIVAASLPTSVRIILGGKGFSSLTAPNLMKGNFTFSLI